MPKTAAIRIHLNKFRPLGSVVACSASMELADSGEGAVSLSGKNLILKRPGANEEAEVDLAFFLDATNYVLLGITFSRTDGADVGQTEFPKVLIETVSPDRKMTVCDMRQTVANYDYAILVQEVATGLVGLIDPEIENTNQE
jgi:hypothetical protein